jgi:hypothetical protein
VFFERIVNFLDKSVDRFCNVGACFRTDFNVLQPVLLSKSDCFLCGDLSLFFQIVFGAHDDLADILRGIVLDLAHPAFYAVQRIFVGNCEGEYDSCCSFVVCLRDIFKPLLTGCIPNL